MSGIGGAVTEMEEHLVLIEGDRDELSEERNGGSCGKEKERLGSEMRTRVT